MSSLATTVVERLVEAFESHRDEARAKQMRAYMRDQFPFLGIMKTERVQLSRAALAGLGRPSQEDVAAVAIAGWKRDEREYQYAGIWYVRRNALVLGPGFLDTAKRLVTTKPWWDTVDDLAANVVGGLVAGHPQLTTTMDDWIGSKNIWLARTALIHQLRYRTDTDAARLFDYCLRRANETDFFIWKAIGWALREYSKTDGGGVVRFLRDNDAVLPGLSKREAMKWLDASRREASSPSPRSGQLPSETS
jgi:3-methyladenine DNA glycosylase AlkD